MKPQIKNPPLIPFLFLSPLPSLKKHRVFFDLLGLPMSGV